MRKDNKAGSLDFGGGARGMLLMFTKSQRQQIRSIQILFTNTHNANTSRCLVKLEGDPFKGEKTTFIPCARFS